MTYGTAYITESNSTSETEPLARKQKAVSLPRSDSIGSTSGRKYLAPTLSDPAARADKERLSTKKKNNKPTPVNKYLPHLNETSEANRMPREVFNNKTCLPKASNAVLEIKDWWNEQLNYASQSSEED